MDRFVVGTGRCGSTLLSRMLSENPKTLSVFEFFNGLDTSRRFSREPVDGKELVSLITAEQPILTEVLRRGYDVEEVVYPFSPKSRYRRDQGLPWILVCALPRMTDDPDLLYDETVAFASGLPKQPWVAHYRDLFGWWAKRCGREHWVERSGSSIEYLDGLHELFPDAKFLHLHRDARETALSMREHHAYRLAVSLLYEPGKARSEDWMKEILESRPPVELFGRYWSSQVETGLRALPKLRKGQCLRITFEDLVRKPVEVLRTVSEFLELGGDGWIQRAASLIRGIPPTRFEKLSRDEQARLAESCRPGEECLAETG